MLLFLMCSDFSAGHSKMVDEYVAARSPIYSDYGVISTSIVWHYDEAVPRMSLDCDDEDVALGLAEMQKGDWQL